LTSLQSSTHVRVVCLLERSNNSSNNNNNNNNNNIDGNNSTCLKSLDKISLLLIANIQII